jgi:hypothetical protein
MVNQYLDSTPDPAVYDFLCLNMAELTARHGGVVGTAFRGFPSYPQRYTEVLEQQLEAADALDSRVEALKVARITKRFSEDDPVVREFLPQTSRQLIRKGKYCAA